MPTYKHPCPACGKFIARDVARCPFCGSIDPFVPGRCPKCRAPIEDAAWIACAKCGTPLREGVAPMPGSAVAPPGTVPAATTAASTAAAGPAATTPAATPATSTPGATSAPAHRLACSGCGTALAPGASFCTVCGTLAG